MNTKYMNGRKLVVQETLPHSLDNESMNMLALGDAEFDQNMSQRLKTLLN
mgnify:CR=1 FL=1